MYIAGLNKTFYWYIQVFMHSDYKYSPMVVLMVALACGCGEVRLGARIWTCTRGRIRMGPLTKKDDSQMLWSGLRLAAVRVNRPPVVGMLRYPVAWSPFRSSTARSTVCSDEELRSFNFMKHPAATDDDPLANRQLTAKTLLPTPDISTILSETPRRLEVAANTTMFQHTPLNIIIQLWLYRVETVLTDTPNKRHPYYKGRLHKSQLHINVYY